MNDEIKLRLAEIQLEINEIKEEIGYVAIGDRLSALEATVSALGLDNIKD